MTDEKTENLDLDEIVGEILPEPQEQQKFYLIIVDGDNVGRIYPLLLLMVIMSAEYTL